MAVGKASPPAFLAFHLGKAGSIKVPASALPCQHWIGGRLRPGPENQPEKPLQNLILCDISGDDPAGRLGDDWWIGEAIGPISSITPTGAAGLLCNVMSIDAEHDEEFNDWYDTEHMARISELDGVLAARRYRAVQGHPTYAAFYHLRDLSVCQSNQWAMAARSPWTSRIQRLRYDNRRLGFSVRHGSDT